MIVSRATVIIDKSYPCCSKCRLIAATMLLSLSQGLVTMVSDIYPGMRGAHVMRANRVPL